MKIFMGIVLGIAGVGFVFVMFCLFKMASREDQIMESIKEKKVEVEKISK